MENRTRLGGLGRSRRPLGDLTAQQNNRGPQPSNENSFPIKQVRIKPDSLISVKSENLVR